MANPVEIKFDDRGLRRGLRKAPAAMVAGMNKGVRSYAADFSKRYAMKRLHGRRGDNPGKGIDSVTLTRTFLARTNNASSLDKIEARIGWFDQLATRIARVHEFGTRGASPAGELPTIVPRRAKALTIPLDAVKTAAGFVRGGGADAYRDENSFILSRPGKNGLIVKKEGGRIIPLFVLVSKVDIPARLNLRADFQSDQEATKRLKFMNAGVRDGLKQAGLKPRTKR